MKPRNGTSGYAGPGCQSSIKPQPATTRRNVATIVPPILVRLESDVPRPPYSECRRLNPASVGRDVTDLVQGIIECLAWASIAAYGNRPTRTSTCREIELPRRGQFLLLAAIKDSVKPRRSDAVTSWWRFEALHSVLIDGAFESRPTPLRGHVPLGGIRWTVIVDGSSTHLVGDGWREAAANHACYHEQPSLGAAGPGRDAGGGGFHSVFPKSF